MKRAAVVAVGLLLFAAAACSSFGSSSGAQADDAGPPDVDGNAGDASAQDADAAHAEDAPVPFPSPCSGGGAGHWLCDDFDRPTTPALPPQWTNIEELTGGQLVLDDTRSRSAPKSLLATTSNSLSQAVLHADKLGTLSSLRCAFDVFVGASGPSGGKVRIAQLRLQRNAGEYVIGELKINEGSLVLEHGGLIAMDGGTPAIIPAVTFDAVGGGWHNVAMTMHGKSYDVAVDGHTTTATFVGGSTLPFTEIRLTFGATALATSGPWKIAIDNLVCDAL